MTRKFVIGIDEAGRGPLAGPITVAAVAAQYRVSRRKRGSPMAASVEYLVFLKNIRDSKKLSAKKRDEWFEKLKSNPKFLIVHASVGNKIIDKLGITKAASRAVKNCFKKLNIRYTIQDTKYLIKLDGSLYAPAEYKNQQTIIKGDEKVPIIAAASIIAKVTRDRKMTRLAKKYPEYSFDIHKGYGTKLHCKAIKRYGMCDIHRRSFCSKKN